MKPITWKVLFFSVPITLMLFIVAAVFVSLVQIYIVEWLAAKKWENVAGAVSQVSVVLTLCPYAGIKWSRGTSPIYVQPVVPWILSIPMTLVLTAVLVVCYRIVYVAVVVTINNGPSEVTNLPQILLSVWETDQPLKIILLSAASEPILTLALLITSLFGYYGPVSKETATVAQDLFNIIKP